MSKKSLERLAIVSGSVYPEFAEGVAHYLDRPLTQVERRRHPNSEQYGRFAESIRQKDVFIFQGHVAFEGYSVDDAIAEQRILLSAARLASSGRRTAVFPYMGYSRADRKSKSGEPITGADLVRDMVFAGAKRLLTCDLHSGQVQGATSKPFDHLTAALAQDKWIEKWKKEHGGRKHVRLVSPDAGNTKSVARHAKATGLDYATVDKRRDPQTNKPKAAQVIGKVRGRHCLFIDDMFDSAGSLKAAAERVMEKGALSVCAMATHGIFSPPTPTSKGAVANLRSSPIERVIVTNTLPVSQYLAKTALAPELVIPGLEVIDMVPLFGEAVRRIHNHESLTELFQGRHLS